VVNFGTIPKSGEFRNNSKKMVNPRTSQITQSKRKIGANFPPYPKFLKLPFYVIVDRNNKKNLCLTIFIAIHFCSWWKETEWSLLWGPSKKSVNKLARIWSNFEN
jgi:hypothetical protein